MNLILTNSRIEEQTIPARTVRAELGGLISHG